MQLKKLLLSTIAISSIMATTAFAGTWRTGAEPNQNRWWYDNDNGTFANNGWQWIDGNNDGTAECYYFDADGWMLADTTTPDGYQVNENGAWIENGTVKTQTSSTGGTSVTNNLDGEYRYCGGSSYILNSQTGTYEVFNSTTSSNIDDWSAIYPMPYEDETFVISNSTDNQFSCTTSYNEKLYTRIGDKWYIEGEAEQIAQNNPGYYIQITSNGNIQVAFIQHLDASAADNPYGWPTPSTLVVAMEYTKN